MTKLGMNIGIISSVVTVAAIYGYSLGDVPSVFDWREYLVQTGIMLLAGLLLVVAYRKYQDVKANVWSYLPLFAAVGLVCCSLTMRYQSWYVVLQQLVLAFWPLILLPWARTLRKTKWLPFPGLGYCLTITAAGWVLLDVLIPAPWRKWEIITLTYLLVTTCLVWRECAGSSINIQEKLEKGWPVKKVIWWSRLREWIPLVFAIVLIFLFHERVRDILMTLSHPLSANDGGLWEVNWLAHRFRLMAECWQGEYGLLLPGYADRLALSNPLLWVSQSLGFWWTAAVLAAEILIMCLLSKFPRETARQSFCLSRVLTSSVLVQMVLALAADGLVITSSLMETPLLSNPTSCLLFPLAMTADVYASPRLKKTAEKLKNERWDAPLERNRSGMVLKAEGFAGHAWICGCTHSLIRVHWVNQETEEVSRIPEEYEGESTNLPISAGGKTFRYLSQLICGGVEGPDLFRDIYGRQVLCVRERFPTFDVYDSMYEDRYVTWFFLRDNDRLTRIWVSDDTDLIGVTEDVCHIERKCWARMQEIGWGLPDQEDTPGDSINQTETGKCLPCEVQDVSQRRNVCCKMHT